MIPLVLATRNPGKVRELAALLAVHGFAVQPLPSDAPEVDETGSTFAENALLKARAAAALTGCPALADDSGLEVDALDGAPGVRSARYADDWPPKAGESMDQRNNRKLIDALAPFPPPRSGRFHCCMALVYPCGLYVRQEREDIVVHGVWEGAIGSAPQGDNGFGYDPLFFDPASGRTAAQLSPEEKMTRSHRAKALKLLLEQLERQTQPM